MLCNLINLTEGPRFQPGSIHHDVLLVKPGSISNIIASKKFSEVLFYLSLILELDTSYICKKSFLASLIDRKTRHIYCFLEKEIRVQGSEYSTPRKQKVQTIGVAETILD